ncbi:MAG: glycosyltransferase family 39 protein [Nitrospirota bacterium]
MNNIKGLSFLKLIVIPTFILWLGLVAINYYKYHLSFYQILTGLIEISSVFFFLSIILVTAFLGGHTLLNLFKIDIKGLEKFLFSIGLGFGVLIYLTFFLGVFGLLYTQVIFGVMLAIILLSLKDFKKFIPQKQKKKPLPPPTKGKNYSLLDTSLIAILCLTILGVLISTLTPNVSWDCAVYHLNVPKIYLSEHKFIPIPHIVASNMPFNIEMLYTIALSIKNPVVAKLIHFTFGILTLLCIYSFCKRYFNPQVALWSMVIFYLNPVTLFVANISYVDLAVTYYFLLAWYGFFIWSDQMNQDSKKGRWLILMAIFCGIMMGAKYTAVFGTVILGIGILIKLYFSERANFFKISKKTFPFAIISSIFVVPWLIKSYLFTGNPVYPAAYNLFGGLNWDKELADQFMNWQMGKKGGKDILSYLLLPWQMTIHGNYGQIFDGILSPLYLIFIPFLILLKEKSKVIIYLLCYSLSFFILWAVSIQILRYLLPILPMWSIIVSYVIDAISRQGKIHKVVVWTPTLIILLSIQLPHLFQYSADVFAAVGLETKDAYLSRTFTPYKVFKYINEKLDKKAKILFLWENRGFYCEQEYLADSFFEASHILKMIRKCGSADALLEELKKRGITHVLINKQLAAVFYDKKGGEIKIIEEFMGRYTNFVYSENDVDLYEMKK